MKIKVLFLCATNGVQSPMAEALLRKIDPEHFEVASAGIERGEMHPLLLEVMKEVGIDLEGKQSIALSDLSGQSFDLVITLDDCAKTSPPRFTKAEYLHWQCDDPTTVMDFQEHRFRTLRNQIAQRLHLFALVQVRFKTIDVAVRENVHQRRVQSAGG